MTQKPSRQTTGRELREINRRLWREERKARDRRKYGNATFGAASDCRRIDPRTGEVIETIQRRED